MKTITIGSGEFSGHSNAVLQRAVNAVAAAGGGVVEIPAGTYEMADALHLRSNVAIVGDGRAVLNKLPSVSSPLANYIGYGHYEFTVAEPDKFRVGMGVCLTDRNSTGFYETVATITGQKGRLFFIDRMLNHDYTPKSDGCAVSVFPLISGYDATNISVRGVVLDGNLAETRRLSGCRGGGVFLLGCHHVHLRGIEARHYYGDAISFQQCTDLLVEECHAHHNRGGGLHPGSGSVRYVFRKNRLVQNTGCGVFYCLRTTYSRCEDNLIEENGKEGISVGERDTNHALLNNVIRLNGGPAIGFREPTTQSGDEVLIQSNRIEQNCQKEGEHEIVIPAGLRRIWIIGNSILPRKGKALRVDPRTEEIRFEDNRVDDRAQVRSDVDGELAPSASRGVTPLEVGPEAAPFDAVRHLNIANLAPWELPAIHAGNELPS